MANDKNANQRKINNSLDLLDRQVNDLYRTTYSTTNTSEELKSQLSDKLDDAIKKSTQEDGDIQNCLLYTSPSPRDRTRSRMPSSA